MKRLALSMLLLLGGLPFSSSAREIFFNGGIDSVAVDTQGLIAFYALVHTNTVAEPGVHFVYTTDLSCAAFDGSATYEGFTDENGQAISPRITGTALTLDCATSLTVDGVADPLVLPLHVFSPAAVVYTADAPDMDIAPNMYFIATFVATESGLPVNAIPITWQIGAAPNGASATLVQDPVYLLNTGRMGPRLLANDKQGRYQITSTYAGHTALINVNQRKK